MLNSGFAPQKSFATLSVTLIVLVAVLAACGGGTTNNNTSKYNGNISVGVDSDIVTLDPLQSEEGKGPEQLGGGSSEPFATC